MEPKVSDALDLWLSLGRLHDAPTHRCLLVQLAQAAGRRFATQTEDPLINSQN